MRFVGGDRFSRASRSTIQRRACQEACGSVLRSDCRKCARWPKWFRLGGMIGQQADRMSKESKGLCCLWVYAVLVILLGACDRQQAIDGAVYVPLPEPKAPMVLPGRASQARIDAAQDYLFVTRHSSTQLGADGLLYLAMCDVAEQYFSGTPEAISAQPPLMLLACGWPASDGGGPMVRVDSVGPNREIYKLIMLFTRGDEPSVRVEGLIPIEEKSPYFITSECWRIEQVKWEDLKERAQSTEDSPPLISLQLGPRTKIPVVIDSSVSSFAAVQDRTGRLSNFVPVSYTMISGDTISGATD